MHKKALILQCVCVCVSVHILVKTAFVESESIEVYVCVYSAGPSAEPCGK